jgi:hypothetical protein
MKKMMKFLASTAVIFQLLMLTNYTALAATVNINGGNHQEQNGSFSGTGQIIDTHTIDYNWNVEAS